MMNKIEGEKRCEVCDCLFVNKDDPSATRCKSCVKLPMPDKVAAEHAKYLYQDIDIAELKKQVDSMMKMLIKMQKDTDKKTTEYSHKCEACGRVFVSNSSASKYCADCGKAK